MAEQDYYMKKLLEDRARFADFINVNVFHGKQVLRAEDLSLLPNEAGIVVVDMEGTKRTIQRRRDVVMKAQFGAYFCVVASENQGKVHYGMAVREMMYDALDYTEQIRIIEERHRAEGDKLEGADFLSHFTKDDRIIPVVTLTLYYGNEAWDGPKSLYEMMGIDEEWESIDLVKKCLPDYKINLIDIREEEELDKYRTSLQHVFGMVKYNKNKQKLYDYTRVHRAEINRMDRESKAAALAILGEQKRLLKILESKTEEEMDMCQAIDELIADGELRGEERGEKRGVLIGREKTEINFIRKQYKKHLTAEQAADILDLDKSHVERVMALFKQYPNCSDEEIAEYLRIKQVHV